MLGIDDAEFNGFSCASAVSDDGDYPQQPVEKQLSAESSNLWGSSQPPRAANRWAAAYRQDMAAAGRQGTKDEQLSHKQTTVSHSESYSVRGISLHEGRAIEPKNGRIHISQRSAEVGESV